MTELSGSFDEYSHFFEVKLDLFDGPIDLLLHLVKQRELPIEKVSLASVAEQYFACIEQARIFDLEIAGEYLVIAATLLSIKSSLLLNDPIELVTDEEGNLIDPHAELLKRLREAEVYKEGAFHLGCSPCLGIDVFAPPPRLHEHPDPEARFAPHDAFLLGKAFLNLLEQAGKNNNLLTISYDSVSIVERMMTIIDSLKTSSGRAVFYKLVPDLTSRASIISCFVALLELCKRQIIHVVQSESFKEIEIVLGDAIPSAGELTSEFDVPKAVNNE